MTTEPARDIVYCSECSRSVGEQLFATAPRADVWFALEYTGTWGNKALPESDLAPLIKERLNGWLNATRNSSFLFIRQTREPKSGFAFYVALAHELEPVLYRLTLDRYDDLLAIDLDALMNGDAAYDRYRQSEPIIAVCVNGRRDVSCAKYGLPVYAELSKQIGATAWQCTHIGGHRFAATLIALPTGACYGYVDADDVKDTLDAIRTGQVALDRLRGRSCYDEPVQAAEHYLRGITGSRDLPGLRLISSDAEGDEQWAVRFESFADGMAYTVHIRRELSEWTTYKSSVDAEPMHMPQFHFVSFEARD